MSEEEFLKKLRDMERRKRVTLVKNRVLASANSNPRPQMSKNRLFTRRRPTINIKVEDMDFFPKCQTEGSAGYDLYSTKAIDIPPQATITIPTGVFLEIPNNMEAQIRPRSSSLLKGLLVAFGTIDADFRGELQVIVRNMNAEVFSVKKRDRLAQLCFANIVRPILNRVEALGATERADAGFGSTGE